MGMSRASMSMVTIVEARMQHKACAVIASLQPICSLVIIALRGEPAAAHHLRLTNRGRIEFRTLVGRRTAACPTLPTTVTSNMPDGLSQRRMEERRRTVMINCYRGSSVLTNKSALLKTMRMYATEHGMIMLPATQLYWMPTTFILRPDGFNDERAMFLAEYERLRQLASASSSPSSADSSMSHAWIVKANRGAKGSDILVSDDADKLIAFVDARVKNSNKSGKNDGSPWSELVLPVCLSAEFGSFVSRISIEEKKLPRNRSFSF